MTMKKSNVKALALAVTCAILAGGGIGLEPVYAVEALYKENSKGYITADATGATGNIVDATKWKLTVIDSGLKIGGIDLGLTNSNAITIGSNTITATDVGNWNSVYSTVGDNNTNGTLAYKTQKISYNATTGTTVEGVVLKDGGITATSDIQGKDITATGALKGASLDVTGDTTVGGNLQANKNAFVKGTLTVDGNIEGKGALKGKTLGIGTNGSEFTVDENGAVKAAGGKVEIDNTGKATFGNIAGNITTIEGKQINTGSIVATDTTVESTISGVKMLNGKITASSMEITGAISLNDLTVNNELTVGAFSVDNTGAVTGLQSINGVAVAKSGTGLTIGSATIGDANPFSSNGFTVDATGNITAGTYNGNTIGADNKFNGVELKGGDVKATKVTADTITDGTATMTGGTVTANAITANAITANTSASLAGVTFDASGVEFNNKEIKNIAKVTATTADLGNLHIEGANITNRVDPTGGAIGLGTTVTVNNAGALGGITKIDGVSVGAVTGNGLQFGGNAVIGATGKPFSSTGFEVDGAGNVTGKSFKVNGSNYLDSTGLTTEKAVIGSVNTLNDQGIDTSGKLHVGDKATFGDSTGTHTTINGGTITSTDGTDSTTIGPNKITTKTLDVEDIILRNEMKDGAGNTITIKGSDGSMSVAGGKFAVDDKGQMRNEYTGYDAAGRATKTTLKTSVDGINANYTNSGNHNNNNLLNINQDGVALGVTDSSNNNLGMLSADAEKATMGYGTANSIVVDKNTIKSALGTDVTRVMINSTTEQSIVDKVGAARRSLKADEIVDVAGGMTITTNNTGTTFSDGTTNTLIKGSAITSTNVTATGTATGVLDGSNLTLTNGANSTALTAGGATFTGATGEKGSPITTINGGTITTDTLNVDRINLGGEVIDKGAAGVEINSKLYMDAQGNFRAAEGNFTVKGGTGTDRGALHNKVGNTSFDTTETGASMKYNNGTVESNVSVGDNSAMVSAGLSSIEVKNDGITNNGKTTFKGAVDATVPTSETTIDGNTIKTGHLITDKLTITGSGNADGNGSTTGSIAFGGNGSITSNIKDGTKEATFKTDEKGTFTEAKDSAGNKTTNTVNAQGNTNEVTDGTNTSTATQTATSIGGVVTNGTVKMSQELTADGVKFEQTGYDEVNIAKGDVTVKNNRNTATPNQEVHLSDLGSLNNLDGELAARDEYTDNKTAVGAINAEAGIRREEVTRLDGRINDVNDRVNKVGAMAAAIASLKSIGYDPQAPSEFSIGLGQYKGETGVAMGFFHYPNKNFMINVSLSTAGGETMGGIGATWRFGHKSPQKLLEEQREAQAKKELAAAEKYQAAAKLAKEAQERAEYAAKLARQAQVSADNAKAAADATQAKHFG